MAYVICEPCVDVKDTACVKVCPVDCIYEFDGETQLYIQPQECIDCGACMPECPVQAIYPLADVPDQWKSYIEINVKIFEKHPIHAAAGETDDAAPTRGTDGAAAPATSKDVEALRALLKDVQAKKLTAADAVAQVVPVLEKVGIRITE